MDGENLNIQIDNGQDMCDNTTLTFNLRSWGSFSHVEAKQTIYSE